MIGSGLGQVRDFHIRSATLPGSRRGAPVFTIEVKDDEESWAFLDGEQFVTDKGDPVTAPPTPAMRAIGQPGIKRIKPLRFKPDRSKELQDYANAIIETILELP